MEKNRRKKISTKQPKTSLNVIMNDMPIFSLIIIVRFSNIINTKIQSINQLLSPIWSYYSNNNIIFESHDNTTKPKNIIF